MKSTSRNMVAITLFLSALLILAVCPAFFGERTRAQTESQGIPEGSRELDRTPVGEPTRENLPNGGYRLVYRNANRERIREEEYNDFGVKTKEKHIAAVYPNGNEARVFIRTFGVRGETVGAVVRFEQIDYDRRGVTTRTETYTDYVDSTPQTKTVTEGRRTRTYRRNPTTGQWEEVTPQPPTQTGQTSLQTRPPARTSASSGFAVASEVAGGLNTTIFATPRGKIRVNLPDDMAAGDTLSGTVIAEPEGKNESEIARNEGELSGYVVELEKQQTSSTGRIFKLAIPAAISTTYLILRDKKGKEVARTPVPVAHTTPPVEEFDLPTIGQQGRPIEVRGPFDGDSGTTRIGVGGNDLEILAESPRKVIARNPSGQPVGPSELEVKEKDETARGEFRTLGVKLSAPKVDLVRGEQTTLTLVVSGLEGIKEEVPLEIENKSSSVIQMAGGEMQRISISPSQVRGGTYTTERPLTGVRRGAFTITGTVVGRTDAPRPPIPIGLDRGAVADPQNGSYCIEEAVDPAVQDNSQLDGGKRPRSSIPACVTASYGPTTSTGTEVRFHCRNQNVGCKANITVYYTNGDTGTVGITCTP